MHRLTTSISTQDTSIQFKTISLTLYDEINPTLFTVLLT
jgi:hypothetical protein